MQAQTQTDSDYVAEVTAANIGTVTNFVCRAMSRELFSRGRRTTTSTQTGVTTADVGVQVGRPLPPTADYGVQVSDLSVIQEMEYPEENVGYGGGHGLDSFFGMTPRRGDASYHLGSSMDMDMFPAIGGVGSAMDPLRLQRDDFTTTFVPTSVDEQQLSMLPDLPRLREQRHYQQTPAADVPAVQQIVPNADEVPQFQTPSTRDHGGRRRIVDERPTPGEFSLRSIINVE